MITKEQVVGYASLIGEIYPDLKGGVADKLKAIIKEVQDKLGFSEAHREFQRIMRKFVHAGELHLAASHVTGFEKIWIVTVGMYLEQTTKPRESVI